jgi:hypothetical protein
MFRLQLESNEDIDALAILHPYSTFLHDLIQYVRGLVKEHDSQSQQMQTQQGEVSASPSPPCDCFYLTTIAEQTNNELTADPVLTSSFTNGAAGPTPAGDTHGAGGLAGALESVYPF